MHQLIALCNIYIFHESGQVPGYYMEKDIRTLEISQRLKEVPGASWPRSFSGVCQLSSLANFLSEFSGTFRNYVLPLSSFLPLIPCPLALLKWELNQPQTSCRYMKILLWLLLERKMLPFPPPPPTPYLQTRIHRACVQLIHFPSKSRTNAEVGCKFNYSTCTEQKQNLIVKFVLLCCKD